MDSGDEDDIHLGSKDFDRMRDSMLKSGYREGLIKGKENGMQEAFNDSYELGLKYGMMVGALRGTIKAKAVTTPEENVGKLNAVSKELEDSCSLLKEIPNSLNPAEQAIFITNFEAKLAEFKSRIENLLMT